MSIEGAYNRRKMLQGSLALAGAGAAALATGTRVSAAPPKPGPHGPQHQPPHKGPSLRATGVTYDTGFVNPPGHTTHEQWEPDLVRREMRIIKEQLNCNAVRVTGGVQERLELATTYAAREGLEVWYAPFTTDLTAAEMLEFLAEGAEHCERLRRHGHDVVFLTGAELSLMQKGFLPGDTFLERLAGLTPTNPALPVLLAQLPGKMNAFFAQAVPVVRERFQGPVGYASIPSLETIDWTPFDFVGADFYPNLVNGEYVSATTGLQSLASHGKPVAITEMGCCPYQGAAAKAGNSPDIVIFDEETGQGIGIKGEFVRDEGVQADYLTGLLDVLSANSVDSAFTYTFASYHLRGDIDIGSLGICRVLPVGQLGKTFPHVPWEPKQAFFDLASYFDRLCRGRGPGRRPMRWRSH